MRGDTSEIVNKMKPPQGVSLMALLRAGQPGKKELPTTVESNSKLHKITAPRGPPWILENSQAKSRENVSADIGQKNSCSNTEVFKIAPLAIKIDTLFPEKSCSNEPLSTNTCIEIEPKPKLVKPENKTSAIICPHCNKDIFLPKSLAKQFNSHDHSDKSRRLSNQENFDESNTSIESAKRQHHSFREYEGIEDGYKRRKPSRKDQQRKRYLRNRGKLFVEKQEDEKLTANSGFQTAGGERNVKSHFKPPGSFSSENHGSMQQTIRNTFRNNAETSSKQSKPVDDRLKCLEPGLIERIEQEVLSREHSVTFGDIIGLDFAKQTVEEMIIWPLQNPEFYTGLRQVPKGLLLFGPPGTGKTLIGKAIAQSVEATFFSISASSLTSKWIGEGEKTVRALFLVAQVRQPSVIFIDEVDSVLGKRTNTDNEASLRIKTEFLVRLEGVGNHGRETAEKETVLVIGATNRPAELDEAVRRRFVKRLYIPLPNDDARLSLLKHLLEKNQHILVEEDFASLVNATSGYSGADCSNLATEAAMGPLRDKFRSKEVNVPTSKELRPICFEDFQQALKSIRASVCSEDLEHYEKWNNKFGTSV